MPDRPSRWLRRGVACPPRPRMSTRSGPRILQVVLVRTKPGNEDCGQARPHPAAPAPPACMAQSTGCLQGSDLPEGWTGAPGISERIGELQEEPGIRLTKLERESPGLIIRHDALGQIARLRFLATRFGPHESFPQEGAGASGTERSFEGVQEIARDDDFAVGVLDVRAHDECVCLAVVRRGGGRRMTKSGTSVALAPPIGSKATSPSPNR